MSSTMLASCSGRFTALALALALVLFALFWPGHQALGELLVQVGPTPIPRGDALGERDITINNGRFAVALAVDTAPPWGVARGGIIDIALVRDGQIGYDFASLADFMPNNWSSWPSSYQTVEIESQTDREIVLKTRRDWGEVELETRITVRDGDSRLRLQTRMHNAGKSGLEGLLTGYVVWPDGGYLFGVPGLSGMLQSPEESATADWSAVYDEGWALALHAPWSQLVSYGGRDRYMAHTLASGQTRTFDAWLQIEAGGDLAPMVAAEIDLQQLPAGTLYGKVLGADRMPLERPAVIVLRGGKPYTWGLGENGDYEFQLPVGEYQVYATAAAHASSTVHTVQINGETRTEQNFRDIAAPGAASFAVRNPRTGEALDARISIRAGEKPLIEYFGKKTFFTELGRRGMIDVELAPGRYQFEISSGGGFTSLPRYFDLQVEAGASHAAVVDVPVLISPAKDGWYSADLHHHSDVLDGFTEPEFVLRSELAAGIDLAFLSDHDSTLNNAEMHRLANLRGLPFIAGTELSPSWAHFNAYPVDADKDVAIDVGRASVQAVFREARRLGANVIHVNHPYGDYGYFRSLELQVERDGKIGNAVPGGYDPGFNLVEITAGSNQQTMTRVWGLWNEGRRVYLAAGSDVHNVWNERSAAARSYAHVEVKPTVDAYVSALLAGHAYASQGPLVNPQIMFGTTVQHDKGDKLKLAYRVEAVSGLRSVHLIERGREVGLRRYSPEQTSAELVFDQLPAGDTWYSLVIEDAAGKFAYTNPVWVDLSQ